MRVKVHMQEKPSCVFCTGALATAIDDLGAAEVLARRRDRVAAYANLGMASSTLEIMELNNCIPAPLREDFVTAIQRLIDERDVVEIATGAARLKGRLKDVGTKEVCEALGFPGSPGGTLPPRGTGLLTGRAGPRRGGRPRGEAERARRHPAGG